MSTYEDSPGGWERHQIAVLNELTRLADQGEKTAVLLQAHEIHFAQLAEQNRQRDEVLQVLVDKTKDLQADVSDLQEERNHRRISRRTRGKLVGVAIAIATWTVGTALTFYEVFFTSHVTIHHP